MIFLRDAELPNCFVKRSCLCHFGYYLNDEQLIVRANINDFFGTIKPVVTTSQILKAQKAVQEVYMDEKIEKYILDLVFATRYPDRYDLEDLKPLINFGASPRGSINLALAAKCYAFIKHSESASLT